MNAPPAPGAGLADVQSDVDARQLAIDRVGIRGLRYPLSFADGNGAAQSTIARCSVYVGLAADQKGTHMSRLVAWIDEARGGLSLATLPGLVRELMHRLESDSAQVEFAFPWFVRKQAPVSGVESVLDYDVRIRAEGRGEACVVTLSVVAPVTSLCPSSKAIASYGAHSQRSNLTLTVEALPSSTAPRIAELIRVAEEEASAELYGILKREDEKFVTEHAYDHPRFVEDLVRGVAARLERDPRLASWRVEAENFESIHNHSAYACIESAR